MRSTPEWLEALMQYVNIRQEVKKLQQQCDGTCSRQIPFDFCPVCRDIRNFDYRLEVLLGRWADTWAVQLFNLREQVVGLMESAKEVKRA